MSTWFDVYIEFKVAIAHGLVVFSINFVVAKHLPCRFLLPHVSLLHVFELTLIGLYFAF